MGAPVYVLASGTKNGCVFSVVTSGAPPGGGAATVYAINGDPQNSQTGQRHFFSDQSAVIRFNASQQASASDSLLQ